MSNTSLRKTRNRRPASVSAFRIARLSNLTLVFALLSLFFFILLIFLRIKFPPYPLMSYQDAIDTLTPLALIPIYWLLFKAVSDQAANLAEELAFLVLAAFWVEGQGMHLSANSISNLMETLSIRGLINLDGNDVYPLTNFYDEVLGHYLWHIGVLGLAALLVYREWRRPTGAVTDWRTAAPAGVIYGFILFAITIEGGTIYLGLPFVLLGALSGLVWGRNRLGQQPILALFLLSCAVASLIYIGWGIYWGGFPQPSTVGII
jgi:hypothetical protein